MSKDDYANQTYGSKFFIKRLAHKKRHLEYVKIFESHQSNKDFSFLDYGAGDGYFFEVLGRRNNAKLFAYDPMDDQYQRLKNRIRTKNLDVIAEKDTSNISEKFDMILCSEVLEHFPIRELLKTLDLFKALLKSNGILTISVPIETGLSGLIKNTARYLMNQKHDGMSAKKLLMILLGYYFDRGDKGYIESHLGFSHHRLIYVLTEAGFEITQKRFSPIPFTGSFLNSQIILVCKAKANATD